MRVPTEAHARAVKLLKVADGGGWAAFGVTGRNDRPTLGTLVDEGLKALEAKAAAKTK